MHAHLSGYKVVACIVERTLYQLIDISLCASSMLLFMLSPRIYFVISLNRPTHTDCSLLIAVCVCVRIDTPLYIDTRSPYPTTITLHLPPTPSHPGISRCSLAHSILCRARAPTEARSARRRYPQGWCRAHAATKAQVFGRCRAHAQYSRYHALVQR